MNRGRYSDQTLLNLPNIVGGVNLPPVTYPPVYLPDINAPQVTYFDSQGVTRTPSLAPVLGPSTTTTVVPKVMPAGHIMLWVTGITLGIILILLFTRFTFYSHLD